ncbi:MAG: tripartite tricarboxylate transporter TctB family protein [Dongiaceae bacterium]
MTDRVFGLICVALAGFFIWQATQIETGFIVDPLGPSAFPIIIGGILGLAGLYPIVKPDAPPAWPHLRRLLEIAFAIAVMVAYAMALPEAGFIAATCVAAALLSWRLGASPLKALAAGIGISVGIYAIFHLALGLSLAKGPWGF